MKNWAISLTNAQFGHFSVQNHAFVTVNDFMEAPESAIQSAVLQKFAKITPQYPGLRAPLDPTVAEAWLTQLTPLLERGFGQAAEGWDIQVWYSVVAVPPDRLIPMQRLPHVDGTDPDLIAMMLYLHHTDHGGTAFFRHKTTGLESLTDETFPRYKAALESDVQKSGMPPARYVTDGAPHFERIHASDGAFNQAVFYRGNVLHSGIIDNDASLPLDPRSGRLTINALFRPK
ncbi:MAG: DUF6445 family protein [Erythrobacter sp.]|nr:DUF6445 family protein [Erythrobacter sp.]